MQQSEQTTSDQAKSASQPDDIIIPHQQLESRKRITWKSLFSKIKTIDDVVVLCMLVTLAILIIIALVSGRSPHQRKTDPLPLPQIPQLTQTPQIPQIPQLPQYYDSQYFSEDRLAPHPTRKKPKITVIGDPQRQGLTTAFSQTNEYFEHHNRGNTESQLPELRIIIIGDQGGHNHHVTKEYKNAIKHISAIHQNRGIHAILTVGDNVYNDGINADTHHLLDTLFKDPFTGYALEDVPFFAVLGNHDHCAKPFEQIRYSMQQLREWRAANRSNAPIWIMPDYYYNVQFEFGAGKKVNLAFLDSMINRGDSDQYSGCKAHSKKDADIRTRIGEEYPAIKRQMVAWITGQAELECDYKATVMHHAIHSTMKHGGCDEGKTLEREHLSNADGTSLFDLHVSGHDHAMEYGELLRRGFKHAIIGSTRSCDGLTNVAQAKDFIAGLFLGRHGQKRRQYDGRWKNDYLDYYSNVFHDSTSGWRNCKDGGFAELVLTDHGGGRELGAVLTYYNANAEVVKEELFAMDVSRQRTRREMARMNGETAGMSGGALTDSTVFVMAEGILPKESDQCINGLQYEDWMENPLNVSGVKEKWMEWIGKTYHGTRNDSFERMDVSVWFDGDQRAAMEGDEDPVHD